MPKSPTLVRGAATGRPDKKYFTLAEARSTLPLVRRIVADIQETQVQRVHLHVQVTNPMHELSQQELQDTRAAFERCTRRLEALVRELKQVGPDLKDPARGLIDFPCLHEGREVLLCWKADEKTIDHWHELDAGFSGRHPVAQLKQK